MVFLFGCDQYFQSCVDSLHGQRFDKNITLLHAFEFNQWQETF